MKNILKIIFVLIISFHLLGDITFGDDTIRNGIIPSGGDSISAVDDGELTISGDNSLLNDLLKFIKDSIFTLLSVIAIGVFLFVGGKLIAAKGNPEEFKKAITSFIYAVVGIFVITAAWGIVKIITGFDI